MSNETNFELLLSSAAEEYCLAMNEEILSRPVIRSISARERRRYRRIRNTGGHPVRWSPFKIALVIALICLSLCFTACVCITRIRTAIKEIILNWYHEYVAIDFEPTAQADTDPVCPPEQILQKAYVADLPEGYTAEVIVDQQNRYCVLFYYQGESAFYLSQDVINHESLWVNCQRQNMTEVPVGQNIAFVMKDQQSLQTTIVWQDSQYEYSIREYGDVDVIELAMKVRLGEKKQIHFNVTQD